MPAARCYHAPSNPPHVPSFVTLPTGIFRYYSSVLIHPLYSSSFTNVSCSPPTPTQDAEVMSSDVHVFTYRSVIGAMLNRLHHSGLSFPCNPQHACMRYTSSLHPPSLSASSSTAGTTQGGSPFHQQQLPRP